MMSPAFLLLLSVLLWATSLWGLASSGHDMRRVIAFLFLAFVAVALGFVAGMSGKSADGLVFAIVCVCMGASVALAGLGLAQVAQDDDVKGDETWKS